MPSTPRMFLYQLVPSLLSISTQREIQSPTARPASTLIKMLISLHKSILFVVCNHLPYTVASSDWLITLLWIRCMYWLLTPSPLCWTTWQSSYRIHRHSLRYRYGWVHSHLPWCYKDTVEITASIVQWQMSLRSVRLAKLLRSNWGCLILQKSPDNFTGTARCGWPSLRKLIDGMFYFFYKNYNEFNETVPF